MITLSKDLVQQLWDLIERYHKPSFVADDPISLPHRFTKLQDQEIIGFWTTVLAWGRRAQIIKSGEKLLELMDNAPHDFILNHQEKDRKPFLQFKHRTFQPEDALYFLHFLQNYYKAHDSLETAFSQFLQPDSPNIEPALIGFHDFFFDSELAPQRTRKHLPTPRRGSTCKRLCMLFRWFVRPADGGVDLGIWRQIKPSQLLIPLDTHVDRIARRWGMLQHPKTDWKAVLELSQTLSALYPEDPGIFDYALFGAGVYAGEEPWD